MTTKQANHIYAIRKNLEHGNVGVAQGQAEDFAKVHHKAMTVSLRKWFDKIDTAREALSKAIKHRL